MNHALTPSSPAQLATTPATNSGPLSTRIARACPFGDETIPGGTLVASINRAPHHARQVLPGVGVHHARLLQHLPVARRVELQVQDSGHVRPNRQVGTHRAPRPRLTPPRAPAKDPKPCLAPEPSDALWVHRRASHFHRSVGLARALAGICRGKGRQDLGAGRIDAGLGPRRHPPLDGACLAGHPARSSLARPRSGWRSQRGAPRLQFGVRSSLGQLPEHVDVKGKIRHQLLPRRCSASSSLRRFTSAPFMPP